MRRISNPKTGSDTVIFFSQYATLTVPSVPENQPFSPKTFDSHTWDGQESLQASPNLECLVPACSM